jgi:DNA replication protein DnaC
MDYRKTGETETRITYTLYERDGEFILEAPKSLIQFAGELEILDTKFSEKSREIREKFGTLPEPEKDRLRCELNMERRYLDLRRELYEEFCGSYEKRGITKRYYDATWENWNADTEDKRKALGSVKNAWKMNLFLCGKSGTGKTHLAMCLVKEGATYRRLPDIFREVKSDFNAEQEIIDGYGSRTLLIIDEVGRQKYSGFEKNLFFEIIDKRWNNMAPTTLITNLNETEFSREYGTAIVDRLRPAIVRFNWESWREKDAKAENNHGVK